MAKVVPDFYREVVGRLVRAGVLDPGMRTLVLCGGQTDRAVLRELGFGQVVISNVSAADDGDFAPYRFCRQDAERLTYPDRSFDFCLVHNGLHHCQSPHRALTEMYRVARSAVLLFEPYDNLLTRVGVRLHIGQEYEQAAVFFNHNDHGGVGDTGVPNYIYRFTEQEIVKTVRSYAPHARHEVEFMHAMRIPWGQLSIRRNRAMFHLVRLGRPALRLMETVAPKQGNHFAALIRKPVLPRALHPWLRQDGGSFVVDAAWLGNRYTRKPGPVRSLSA